MMEKSQKFLADILHSIQLIDSFVENIRSFEEYQADLKTQSAVERQLGIIREAVNRYRQVCPNEILENSKQIVAFRNRIIHAYDSIDNSIVWVIIKKYLNPLKKEVEQRFE